MSLRQPQHPSPGTGRMVHVPQGRYELSDAPDAVMVTVLGSCVSACLHDPVRGIGGINHFLLPEADASDRRVVNYGSWAMEALINALLHRGARKERLEAKLFGGARVLSLASDIGRANAAFAEGFLRNEGIACTARSLGGTAARKLRYWPASGRAQVMLLPTAALLPPSRPALPRPHSGDVDLF